MGHAMSIFFLPHPLDPDEESKGQISVISVTMSISKVFIPNFVCVLTNDLK